MKSHHEHTSVAKWLALRSRGGRYPRLHSADGTVSIVMPVSAFGAHDAKHQAASMLKDEISYAVIWQDLDEVATVHRAANLD